MGGSTPKPAADARVRQLNARSLRGKTGCTGGHVWGSGFWRRYHRKERRPRRVGRCCAQSQDGSDTHPERSSPDRHDGVGIRAHQTA